MKPSAHDRRAVDALLATLGQDGIELGTPIPEISKTQHNQLAALGPLYRDWNAKINLISRKDMDQFYTRHVLHSLAIARVDAS